MKLKKAKYTFAWDCSDISCKSKRMSFMTSGSYEVASFDFKLTELLTLSSHSPAIK